MSLLSYIDVELNMNHNVQVQHFKHLYSLKEKIKILTNFKDIDISIDKRGKCQNTGQALIIYQSHEYLPYA